MNETKKRIRAYKAALPVLRERVIAVALLLAMSVAMMTSASFAWLTISRKPALSGANTTVAANGNLEIALVPSDGSEPKKSAVGDSSASEGQSVVKANLTWGNLINLSDESYGLENLTLRPAQLNPSALLTSPLYGAVYKEDGRIEKLSSSFAYATWQPENSVFLVTNDKGVRAISSTTVEAVGFAQEVQTKRDAAESANLLAGSAYLNITQNDSWMGSLATIMGIYMTAKMNSGQGDANLTNPTIDKADILNLTDVFEAFQGAYVQQTQAMVALLNYQLFLQNNSEEGSIPYTEYTAAALLSDNVTEAYLKNQGLQLNGLNQLKTDIEKLETNLAKLQVLCEQGTVKWEDDNLNAIVADLINVGICTLDGTPVNNIGVSNALQYLDGKSHDAVITNGILFNFEKLNGSRCYVTGVSVSAKVKRMGLTIPASITATISTNAPVPAQFLSDLDYADTLNKGAQGVEVAQDTYGLAIDFWVRTNAANGYLTLEGNVLTKTDTIRATGTDASGNVVELYTLTRAETIEAEDGTTENVTYTLDLYKVETTDDTGVAVTIWHNANGHAEVALETGEEPTPKMTDVVTVIGYEGENRIWEDSSMLSTDSTTQGSGSCYVYYADTPEDQARSLKLLESMNVVFVDDRGNQMAVAVMDTENFYAESGRVTVPLVLRQDSLNLGEDANGETQLAITALEQNVAKRITAIVYLDGTKLTNKDVLAASDIQGKLNIQFGSSEMLNHVEDEALMNATRSVTATVTPNSFQYDQSLENRTPMTSTVTIKVDGDQPQSVTAFFIRAISTTQGSREKVMTFTKQSDNSWTASHTFTAPGNYVLRSVELDGVTYDLTVGDQHKVLVEGFTIESLNCSQSDENNHIGIMTADSYYGVDVNLKFASSNVNAMPKTVQGRFLRTDGTAVNINFTYDSTTGAWKGSGTFLSSGSYTLQYLVLDGEYTELPSIMWQTASVYLGMRTVVYTNSPTSFRYVPSELADNEKNLYMSVKILDNTGEEMIGLSDLSLYYAMQGSTVAERGMSGQLTWNGSTGYYETTFPSKVGMFHFSHVTVGGNTITNATMAPTFKIISPEPPVFNSGNALAYQYAKDITPQLSVLIDNCEAATVYADIVRVENGVTTEYFGENAVEGNLVNGSWVFMLPADADGSQDGIWSIQYLRLSDVYAVDGTAYTDDNPLVFDLSNEENVSAKVVSTITPRFPTAVEGNLTGNAFMEAYSVEGLEVYIEDYLGEAIMNGDTHLISDVKLTFTYKTGTSEAYGGYTSDSLTNATDGATITVPLELDDEDPTHFVQTAAVNFLYAGEYTTQLRYNISNKLSTYSNTDEKVLTNMPVFTVSSNAPTVKMTGISPAQGSTNKLYTAAISSDGSVDTSNLLSADSFRYTDNSATVYIYVTNDEYEPQIPTVTLQLSGMPSDFTSASLEFGNAASSSYAVTYTFGPGTALTDSQKIGGGVNGAEGNLWNLWRETKPKIFPAGKQTVDAIEVLYNGMTFDVVLSNAVIINQPQYPPYVTFAVNDSIFTGTVPSNVYSEDGETITVKLPTVTNWTEDKSSTANGEFVVQSGYPTIRNVYTQRSETTGSGCNQTTTTYYTPYIETTTVSTATSATTTWVNTHAVTGWKVGNTVYQPGDEVTVTGNQTISAVVTITEGTKTTTASTTTRTVIEYTANGAESTTNPGGTRVTGVEGSTNDVVS